MVHPQRVTGADVARRTWSWVASHLPPGLTAPMRDIVAFAETTAGLLLTRIDADHPVESAPGPAMSLTVRDSTAPLADRRRAEAPIDPALTQIGWRGSEDLTPAPTLHKGR